MELSRSLLEATLTADCPQNQYGANKGHVLGLDFHEIARRSDRVIGLSMLTLIYRSIPPEKPSMSAFCQECIDAARDTLREHDLCVALITRARGKTVFLEAYINWFVNGDASFHLRLVWSDMQMQDHHSIAVHSLHHPVLPHHRDV